MRSSVLSVPLTPDLKRRRARIAALTRHDPKRAAIEQRDFAVEKVAEHIKALVESAPPLTEEQRLKLRRLLAPRDGR